MTRIFSENFHLAPLLSQASQYSLVCISLRRLNVRWKANISSSPVKMEALAPSESQLIPRSSISVRLSSETLFSFPASWKSRVSGTSQEMTSRTWEQNTSFGQGLAEKIKVIVIMNAYSVIVQSVNKCNKSSCFWFSFQVQLWNISYQESMKKVGHSEIVSRTQRL